MANLEPAKELLVMAADGLAKKAVEKAAKEYVPTLNSASDISVDLSNFKIPLVTNDPKVNEIIDEFELRDPKKMVRFLIELHSANYECIMTGISEIKQNDMDNTVSIIDQAKQNYYNAMANEKFKETYLVDATKQLNLCLPQLLRKALNCIEATRKIDKLPKHQFFIQSKKAMIQNIDENNYLAKTAVKGMIDAYNLYTIIATELKLDINNSVIKTFENSKRKLIEDDNCSLMHAYDKDSREEFWLKLPELFDHISETADVLQDFLDSTEDDDFDFNNIEFN